MNEALNAKPDLSKAVLADLCGAYLLSDGQIAVHVAPRGRSEGDETFCLTRDDAEILGGMLLLCVQKRDVITN